MAASEMAVHVNTRRDGKLLTVFVENGPETIIDLQQHYHLTDEQTAELIARLDNPRGGNRMAKKGGKPSRGTPRDQRLSENKPKPAPKPKPKS